jgi:hypothetical protein
MRAMASTGRRQAQEMRALMARKVGLRGVHDGK